MEKPGEMGMIPEKVFQQILVLGEAWRVARMDYQEKEQRMIIRVEETPALRKQESCPRCQHKVGHGCASQSIPILSRRAISRSTIRINRTFWRIPAQIGCAGEIVAD